jgi:nucleotide-binding universal stress UspA family protein
MRHKGRERLEWLKRQHSFDRSPEQILLEGRAADELTAWIADVSLPLLALATHGDERDSGSGLGSTAQRLLEIAPASLLLIPPTATETPVYQRIVVPLDGSCRAESVLPTVVMLARDSAAEVMVVHVVPQPQFTQFEPLEAEAIALRDQIMRRNEQVARLYLERVLRYLRSAGIEARSILVHGDARECVQRIAAEQDADLIVLAAHGQTGRADMACGSVASYLAAHAARPLLIVRDDEEGRAGYAGHSTQEYCSFQFMQ